jgi:hypothetical protein
VFGQVVFTAPDVDHDYFADLLREVGPLATRATLYASDNDLALKSSEALHGAPRAGLAGKFIITQPGLDSIDMSAVKADLLGHGYFAADAGAIFDLFRLLWRGDPPPQRCGMTDRQNGAPTRFWSFNDANCKGYDLLEAGVLLKRFGDQARSQLQTRLAALTDPSQRRQLTQILAKLNDLIGPDKPAAVR